MLYSAEIFIEDTEVWNPPKTEGPLPFVCHIVTGKLAAEHNKKFLNALDAGACPRADYKAGI